MDKVEKLLKEMEACPKNIRFADLAKLCAHYFGKPRNKGTSHHIYKTPWQGDPRVNIQKSKNGDAKPYQVRQILSAIRRMEDEKNG